MDKLQAFIVIATFVGGYAASVLTWNSVHTFFIGAQAKITQLRQQASDLETKIRSL